ncbi:PREDICTED: uncharacterized protein LOC108567918 [Nicrophorus vespilloides]|uniref:Uncharacterized protein LOC108567918 n=1 Tax=Nicrophorus vespilloides TaxID=110193 RepID=A0ABM1NBJ5_NICVS|nr:PREDICTED: uncharacterized protein LOC108567918 [Nicrophorus vespilloides]
MIQFKNIVVGLVLYGMVIVIDSQVANNDCPDAPIFKCNKNDLTYVTIGTHKLNCMNDELCNINNFYPCSPCMGCNEQFSCTSNDESHVEILNKTYECPKYKICNKKPEPGNCDPCVESKCQEPIYKCVPNKPSVVIIGQMEMNCKTGSICNKNNKQPCSPCIENTGGITVPETNTTFVLPDCNDGLSGRMPCRSGPVGADYYFRCKKKWCWYEQEMMHCSQIFSDNTCKRDFSVCRQP